MGCALYRDGLRDHSVSQDPKVMNTTGKEQPLIMYKRSKGQQLRAYGQMDGVVIGTTPLVPVNDTSAVPMAQLIDTTTIGALTAPAPPAVRRRPSFSFAAVGRSTFTFTFPTPSLGDYVIMASILSPNGTKVPISDPAVSPVLDVSIHKRQIAC